MHIMKDIQMNLKKTIWSKISLPFSSMSAEFFDVPCTYLALPGHNPVSVTCQHLGWGRGDPVT